MRKLFLNLTLVFIVLGTAFAFLPLDTIALAPLFLAILCGIFAYTKSDIEQRKRLNILLIITLIISIAVISKHFLLTDEVTIDKNFEKTKIESQKEAQKTLEEDLE